MMLDEWPFPEFHHATTISVFDVINSFLLIALTWWVVRNARRNGKRDK